MSAFLQCTSLILQIQGHTYSCLPVSSPCAALFAVTIITGLIVDNVADDKGNCRIPSQSICILTREKAEPSEKREHAIFEQCLRGAGVLICAFVEGEGKVGPCLRERAKALLWSLVLHLS